MKLHYFIFLLLLLPSTAPLFAESDPNVVQSVGHAMNMATRQRMLSQRAAKAFALSTQKIDVDLNEEQLMGCISTFEANQQKLASYAPNLEVKTKITRVNNLWANYKEILLKERSIENLMDVIENNQTLFLACDEVVKAINDYATEMPEFNPAFKLGKSRNIVDAAARVRSLSQRMTYYSVVQKSGIRFDHTQEYLEAAHTDFRMHLGTIMLFSENTEAAQADIAEVVVIWEKYNVLAKMLSGEYDLITMNEDFNKVVSLVDRVVLEYENALDVGEQVSRN